MIDSSYTLLLVDDDEDDYFLAQDYLEEMGEKYNLEWVSRYDEALPKLANNEHDLYLVDFRLGRKTGLELLEAAISQGCTKPIIMLTGKGDQEIDLKSMKAGAVDYLVKGEINAHTLERAIRYALENSENKQTILEQQERYQMLFSRSIDPIFLADENLKLLEANSSFSRLTGVQEDHLDSTPLKSIFVKDEEYDNFLKELNEKKAVNNFPVSIKKLDGSEAPCTISMAELNYRKQSMTGYQGLIHDISELRKAEADIRLAEKLSLTGKMARMIAHEVRNPLTNINLSLEQLKEDLDEAGIEDLTIYTDIIRRNSHRINDLITELLKSAKPSELDLQPHDPNELVKSTLEFSDDRLKLLEVDVVANFEECKGKVKFDMEKMKIALINIVTNAIEAMEGMESPQLKVNTFNSEDAFNICIADNGHGMKKEEVEKLFDPFYTGKNSGMGLGMTSTQNIVQSHHAQINVESDPGNGTAFTISLPFSGKI
ncbi:two-component system sensor histidine kinase NtrB [Halocola ammonii]